MKTYATPLYPALMIRLPGDGRRNIKAAGGYFNVADEDVEAFEKVVAERPHYRISQIETPEGARPSLTGGEISAADAQLPDLTTAAGSAHGTVVRPVALSESEVHPELVKIDTLESMKVPELDAELEKRGLATDGKKADKVQRLAEATNTFTGLGDNAPEDADATTDADADADADKPADGE